MVELECFHGTTLEFAQSILREGFRPSIDQEGLRLGVGAYFFGKGTKSDYGIECAREIERYHFAHGKHKGKYAILSCTVKCNDDQFFDMYKPDYMETFHRMRYKLYQERIERDPLFKFPRAEVADTITMDFIRKIQDVAIVQCPQFFGMFMKEKDFRMDKRHPQPKTMVPNVLMICADCNKAIIDNVVMIEEGDFDDESRYSI